MSRLREAEAALSHFDPLLIELVRAEAPQHKLLQEGFTSFEVSAVRTLVKRDTTLHRVVAGDPSG